MREVLLEAIEWAECCAADDTAKTDGKSQQYANLIRDCLGKAVEQEVANDSVNEPESTD